ncbi:MAG: HlyD family efflux transporter periplasmic adaptor subunit [Patescibacteria group bacterium]|jgi:HlyD family secretion protein
MTTTTNATTFTLPLPQPKRFYQRWWFWILIIILGLIGIGAFIGWNSWQNQQLTSYDYLKNATTVKKRTFKKTISTNGQITPDESLELTTTRSGQVTDVNVKVGDDVEQDDLLVELDSGEDIKAPFDGKVLNLATFVDDKVLPNTPVITIGFRSSHIEFLASEAEVIDLRVGQHTSLSVPAYNNGKDEYNATVLTVAQEKTSALGSDQTTGAAETGYLIKVSANNLPAEIQNLIGLSVDVIVDIYQVDNVLSLEPAAVQYDEDNNAFVYLVPNLDESFINRAKQSPDITTLLQTKSITVDFTGDDYVKIGSGLKENENVLLYIPPATNSTSPF